MDRIELSTSPLPRECSTSEPHGRICYQLRFQQHSKLERVAGIEPASSAWKAEVLPLNYTRLGYHHHAPITRARRGKSVVGEGFEPSKAVPSDLQSDPFDRSGTPPGKRGIIQMTGFLVNHTLNKKISASPSLATYSRPSAKMGQVSCSLDAARRNPGEGGTPP